MAGITPTNSIIMLVKSVIPTFDVKKKAFSASLFVRGLSIVLLIVMVLSLVTLGW